MRLTIGNIPIREICFGPQTAVNGERLTICQEELVALLREEKRIANVEVYLANPGDSIRIAPVKDVIEPRVKPEGPGHVFPGLIGSTETVGSGRTRVLKGAAVVTTGKIVGFQEGIIDMSGPGAAYSPFSKTHNIVVKVEPVPGLPPHEHESVVRMAGLQSAAYLGETAKYAPVADEEVYETGSFTDVAQDSLPKVAYIYMLQSQGLLHDTYVYGVDAKRILPTLIAPTEIFDGAIVSGNCVSACDKNTTYVHQNNPVIKELFARHGKELIFAGVIITNENVTLADKERSSSYTAKLAGLLGIDGAVISEEGFGNPDADLVMNCRKLERLGIKTVLLTDEYAGRDGGSQSLADITPEADAVVTVGNANETIRLPKLDTFLGHTEVIDVIAGGFSGSVRPDGSIEVEIQAITGSTNEIGFLNLSTKGY